MSPYHVCVCVSLLLIKYLFKYEETREAKKWNKAKAKQNRRWESSLIFYVAMVASNADNDNGLAMVQRRGGEGAGREQSWSQSQSKINDFFESKGGQ